MGFFLVQGRWGKWGQAAQAALGVAAFLLRTIGIALFAAWVAEALLRQAVGSGGDPGRRRSGPLFPLAGLCRPRALGRFLCPPSRTAYQRAAYMYYNVSYAENHVPDRPVRSGIGQAHTLDSTAAARTKRGGHAGDAGRDRFHPPGILGEWALKQAGKWIGHPGISRLERVAVRRPRRRRADRAGHVRGSTGVVGAPLLA